MAVLKKSKSIAIEGGKGWIGFYVIHLSEDRVVGTTRSLIPCGNKKLSVLTWGRVFSALKSGRKGRATYTWSTSMPCYMF